MYFDFECRSTGCTLECMPQEIYIEPDGAPRCEQCGSYLVKIFTTAPGYDHGEAYRAVNYVAMSKKEYEKKMIFGPGKFKKGIQYDK